MRAVARLQIETLVALDELPDGTCVAYPVVDPSWASAGSEEDALTELRLVLSEELAGRVHELSEHEAVPFVSAVGHIVRLLKQHADAVGENDQYVLEAGRRARAVHVSSKIYSGIGIPLTAALPIIPSRPSSFIISTYIHITQPGNCWWSSIKAMSTSQNIISID